MKKNHLRGIATFLSITLLLLTFFSSSVWAMSEKEREQLSKDMLGQIVKIHGEPEKIDDEQKIFSFLTICVVRVRLL